MGKNFERLGALRFCMASKSNFLTNILNKAPFNGRLFIGDYCKQVKAVIDSLKIAQAKTCVKIVSREQDFLALAKNLKDSLIKSGVLCESYVIEDVTLCINLDFEGAALIIGVGDSDFLDGLLDQTKHLPTKKLAVCNYGVFAPLFCPDKCFLPVNGARVKLGLYDFVVFDVGLYKTLKKNQLADAFSFIASKKLQLTELKLNGISACTDVKVVEGLVESATGLINGITQENFCGVSIVAQLILAQAIYIEPNLHLSPSYFCAQTLSMLTGNTKEECLFALSQPLLTAYGVYLSAGKVIFDAPSICDDIDRLGEIHKTKSAKLIGYVDMGDIASINHARQNACYKKEDILRVQNSIIKYKLAYDKVYKGRKRRDAFDKKQLSLAIAQGGALGYGLLKGMYDDGFLKALTKNL